MIEYAIILGVIVVGLLAALSGLAQNATALWQHVHDESGKAQSSS